MRNYVQWNSILHFHGIPLCISAEFYFAYPQNSIPCFQGILHFHRIPWWRILICSSAIFWRIFLWKFAGLAEQNFRSSNYETKQELQSQLIHDFHRNTSGDVGIGSFHVNSTRGWQHHLGFLWNFSHPYIYMKDA